MGVFTVLPKAYHHKRLTHFNAMSRQLPADTRGTAQLAAVDVSRQRHQKVRVVVRHVFCAKALAVVLGDKAGIEVTRHKLRVRQQGRLERDVAADAANHKTIECLTHFGNRVQPVLAMHDELGNHRVVEHRYLAAVLHAGIHTHAIEVRSVGCKHGGLGRLKAHQPAG